MRPHLWQASALALLFAVCVLAAPGAFLLWYLAGPPLPGLVPGILGMAVFFSNAIFAIVAVVRCVMR